MNGSKIPGFRPVKENGAEGVETIDVRTFTAEIERHKALIFQICNSFVHNYFDAEDLTQETFLTAFHKLDTFDGQNFRAWLVTIASNKCRNFLTDPRRRMQLVSDETLGEVASPEPTPEDMVIHTDQHRRLLELCDDLREPYREVATAYFCKNKKVSEIAAELKTPVRTIETRLYRARKLLRESCREEWKEENAYAMQRS